MTAGWWTDRDWLENFTLSLTHYCEHIHIIHILPNVCHKYNTYGNCTEHNMTMAPCIFGIFGCLKKSCLKTFSLIKEQTVQITLWPFMLQENCIMSISFPKKFAHLEICALIRHRPTDYHSLGVQTFQSVCLSIWCPQLQTAVLTWPPHSGEKPGAWQVTAHQTQTLAHKRKEGIHCVCVFVTSRAARFVLV